MAVSITIGLQVDNTWRVLTGRKEVALVMEWCRPTLDIERDTDEGYEMSIHNSSLKTANQAIPMTLEDYATWREHTGGVFVSELKFFTGSQGVSEEQFMKARIFLNQAAKTKYDATIDY